MLSDSNDCNLKYIVRSYGDTNNRKFKDMTKGVKYYILVL